MKKAAVVTAIVFLVSGCGLFFGAWIAAGSDFSKLSAARYMTTTYTVNNHFSAIEVDEKEADITLKPSDGKECHVVCEEREDARHTVLAANGILKISLEDKREWYDHLTLFSNPLSVTVYLPYDRYEMLTIYANTGNVSIPDSFSFSDISVSLSTGDIVCEATASELLKLKTGTGNICLNGVCAGQAQLSASTGNIMLKNTICSDNLKIKTSTGNVRLDDCDAQNIIVKTSTGSVTGTLRTEKIFNAKTSTGKVCVPDTGTGGKCDITTSTGDIDMAISK